MLDGQVGAKKKGDPPCSDHVSTSKETMKEFGNLFHLSSLHQSRTHSTFHIPRSFHILVHLSSF